MPWLVVCSTTPTTRPQPGPGRASEGTAHHKRLFTALTHSFPFPRNGKLFTAEPERSSSSPGAVGAERSFPSAAGLRKPGLSSRACAGDGTQPFPTRSSSALQRKPSRCPHKALANSLEEVSKAAGRPGTEGLGRAVEV